MKKESIKPPDLYIGGHVIHMTLDNGIKAWAFGSSQYFQAALKNVDEYLVKQGKKPLPVKGQTTPLTNNYHPEIDIFH